MSMRVSALNFQPNAKMSPIYSSSMSSHRPDSAIFLRPFLLDPSSPTLPPSSYHCFYSWQSLQFLHLCCHRCIIWTRHCFQMLCHESFLSPYLPISFWTFSCCYCCRRLRPRLDSKHWLVVSASDGMDWTAVSLLCQRLEVRASWGNLLIFGCTDSKNHPDL